MPPKKKVKVEQHCQFLPVDASLVEETIDHLPSVLLAMVVEYAETENDKLAEFIRRLQRNLLNFHTLTVGRKLDHVRTCPHVLGSLRENTQRFYELLSGDSDHPHWPWHLPSNEEQEQLEIILAQGI